MSDEKAQQQDKKKLDQNEAEGKPAESKKQEMKGADQAQTADKKLEENIPSIEVEKKAAPTPGKKETKKPARTAHHKKSENRSTHHWLTMMLLGIVTVAAGYGGYFLWQQQEIYKEELKRLSVSINEEQRSFASKIDTQQQSDKQELQKKLTHLDKSLGEIINRLGDHSKLAWQVAEAEYLMSIANERLLLEGDANLALQALRAADARIRDSKDPWLLKVREKLADEMRALDAIEPIDSTGMMLTIQSLVNRVDKLPIDVTVLKMPEQAARKVPEQAEAWSDVAQMIWADLKSLLVIRQHDKPARPLLAPENAYFLKSNLLLQLESAKLALLKRDQVVFRSNCRSAANWLKEYFDAEDNEVKQAARTLQGLQKRVIDPKLPDISGSLRLIRDSKQQLSARNGRN